MRTFKVKEHDLNDIHTTPLIGRLVTEVYQIDEDMVSCIDSDGNENDFAFDELEEIKVMIEL